MLAICFREPARSSFRLRFLYCWGRRAGAVFVVLACSANKALLEERVLLGQGRFLRHPVYQDIHLQSCIPKYPQRQHVHASHLRWALIFKLPLTLGCPIQNA